MTGKKILVLGATGLIGSAVSLCVAADNEVHGLSRMRNEEAARELEKHGVTLIRTDAAAYGFDDLDRDYDYVFNEILVPPDECDTDPDRAFQTHAFLVARLIERFRGCKGIVLGSTGSVYRPSDRPVTEDAPLGANRIEDLENYVLSKICGDKFAEYHSMLHGVPVSILRYYHPYDTRPSTRIASYLRGIVNGQPLRAGEMLVNPIFISDVAEMTVAGARLCASPPTVINVGGEEVVSLHQLAEMIGAAAGKTPIFAPTSDRAVDSWVCDSAKRIQLLGRQKVSLREGIAKTVEDILPPG